MTGHGREATGECRLHALCTPTNIMSPKPADGSLSDCNEEFFECFKDCCKRAIQFCNHREKRCQDCSLRESFCGKNQTYVPMECDLFCYNHLQHSQSCPLGWLAWTGWAVATIIVTALIIAFCLYKCKKQAACNSLHTAGGSSSESLMSVDTDTDNDIDTEVKEREGFMPSSHERGGAASRQSGAASRQSGAASRQSGAASRQSGAASRQSGAAPSDHSDTEWLAPVSNTIRGVQPTSPETDQFVVLF